MTRAEEYRLSRYQEFGQLREEKTMQLVRDQDNGRIGVKKVVSSELQSVYLFLKQHSGNYIPQIYECISDGDKLIVVEEYLTGKNLEEWMQEGKRFDIQEAAQIICELCRALKPLHDANPPLICRDLKTENVMLTADGRIKLIDFNIARRYEPGKKRDTVMMGTQGFAAPEQFGFSQTDARTDIYALGVLFNYLLIGKLPVEELAAGIPGRLIRRCIAMNPDDRYQSVDELSDDMRKNDLYFGKTMEKRALYEQKYQGMRQKASQDTGDAWWKIPGFRSNNVWKMACAALGYLFLSVLCFSMTVTSKDGSQMTGMQLYINRICIFASQIGSIFVIGNYRGIREKIPFLNPQNKILRILLDVVIYCVLVILAACIAAVFD